MVLFAIFTRAPSNGVAEIAMVREQFSRSALVFGPFWLLAKRAWLAALAVVALVLALMVLAPVIGLDAALGLYAVIALYLGFAAPDLARAALGRRGFVHDGDLWAEDAGVAERLWYGRAASVTP